MMFGFSRPSGPNPELITLVLPFQTVDHRRDVLSCSTYRGCVPVGVCGLSGWGY